MEPKYSLTAYTATLAIAGLAVALFGHPNVTLTVSCVVLGSSAALALTYLLRTRKYRARRLRPRRLLDRWVLAQWVTQSLVLIPTALAVRSRDGGIWDAPIEVRALAIGAALAVMTIYISAVVDWYWVLPKVAGMTGPLPCAGVGGEKFAGTTKVWFFHRASATAIVTAIIAGVPGYLAGIASDTGGEGAFWVIVGAAASIGFNVVAGDIPKGFKFFLNPPANVGQIVMTRVDPKSNDHSDVAIIDVALQGAKYQVLSTVEGHATPVFADKGRLMKLADLDEVLPSARITPVCDPGHKQCRALNWYCFLNPEANALDGNAVVNPPPEPWPAGA